MCCLVMCVADLLGFLALKVHPRAVREQGKDPPSSHYTPRLPGQHFYEPLQAIHSKCATYTACNETSGQSIVLI